MGVLQAWQNPWQRPAAVAEQYSQPWKSLGDRMGQKRRRSQRCLKWKGRNCGQLRPAAHSLHT